jgi:hypothetical protein
MKSSYHGLPVRFEKRHWEGRRLMASCTGIRDGWKGAFLTEVLDKT